MLHDSVVPRVDIPQRRNHSKQDGRIEFHIDKDRRLVVVKFGRRTTMEDIANYAQHLVSDPDFQPTFSEIIDLREVEYLNLEANDFLKLADKIDPFSMEAKRAFVVRTSVQSHAARMHKILRNNRNIEIFRSFEEGERWVLL